MTAPRQSSTPPDASITVPVPLTVPVGAATEGNVGGTEPDELDGAGEEPAGAAHADRVRSATSVPTTTGGRRCTGVIPFSVARRTIVSAARPLAASC